MSPVSPSETNVDGQALRKLATKKDELTEKIIGPTGYLTKMFTLIDIHLLVFLIGVQSSFLNYFILKYNSMLVYYYTLFAFDLITIFTIIWSIVVAKRYFELQDKIENPEYYKNGIDCNPDNNFPKDLIFCRLPKKLGVLPFIWICWFLYTICLISKILIIFITDVPNHMLSEPDPFKIGPQALEMVFALTSIVFLIFMYAHRNSENDYHRKLTKSWVDDMISHTVFEIFDSIMFLDLVMPERDHHHDDLVRHEIRENISPALEYTIIGLAAANFLIPTINLYHLSKLSACTGDACRKLDLKGKLRHIFIHFIRLISVNFAYLIIRCYISANFNKGLTIFIIKNVLCIIMSARSLFIEIHDYLNTKKILKEHGSQSEKLDKNHHHSEFELQNFANNVNDKIYQNGSKSLLTNEKDITNLDTNFEDIALK